MQVVELKLSGLAALNCRECAGTPTSSPASIKTSTELIVASNHCHRDTYEQRLLRPFQDALPPPPHFHPGRLVVHKPDLPPTYGVQVCARHTRLFGITCGWEQLVGLVCCSAAEVLDLLAAARRSLLILRHAHFPSTEWNEHHLHHEAVPM